MPHVDDPWAAISLRVEDSQDAIIGETLDGVVVKWNAGAVKLLGHTAEEMIGRSASHFSTSSSYGTDLQCLISLLKRGERISPFEAELICKDGSVIAVSVMVSPVFDGTGRLIGLSRIVRVPSAARAEAALHRSEVGRQQLEREVAHLARWSAMGQMAIVLAHELNQPLTAIVSYLTSARRLLRTGEQSDLSVLVGAMERANDQASRAAKIVGHLRSFVSQGDVARQRVPLAAAILDASDLVLITAKQAGILVDFQLAEDALVLADRVQIQQVIFNLMRNAVEAMVGVPSGELRVSTARRGDDVIVSISDNGPGLPPEVVARLFEPFVTTKPDGMGVGLSICQAIITAHGGELWIDDTSSSGATFLFKLPIAMDADQ